MSFQMERCKLLHVAQRVFPILIILGRQNVESNQHGQIVGAANRVNRGWRLLIATSHMDTDLEWSFCCIIFGKVGAEILCSQHLCPVTLPIVDFAACIAGVSRD